MFSRVLKSGRLINLSRLRDTVLQDLVTVSEDAMADEAVFEFTSFFQGVVNSDIRRALLLAFDLLIYGFLLQISSPEKTVVGQSINLLLLLFFAHQVLTQIS